MTTECDWPDYWLAEEYGAPLRCQQCNVCGYFYHPPTVVCYRCDSRDLELVPISGRGALYSWTLLHRDPPERLSSSKPYLVAQVELHEQAGLFVLTNLPSVTDADSLRIGQPVQLLPRQPGPCSVPDFELV